jgi:hypothetical protein
VWCQEGADVKSEFCSTVLRVDGLILPRERNWNGEEGFVQSLVVVPRNFEMRHVAEANRRIIEVEVQRLNRCRFSRVSFGTLVPFVQSQVLLSPPFA